MFVILYLPFVLGRFAVRLSLLPDWQRWFRQQRTPDPERRALLYDTEHTTPRNVKLNRFT